MSLPQPSPDALEQSGRLLTRLRALIDAEGGWISFATYMAEALYAPGLGYYSAGLRKFGRGGDFVTAPELGPLFAECLANALAPLLQQMEYSAILEIGAGSGALAADLWNALERLRALPERYWILERSADLRERQIERLTLKAPQALPRVAWIDSPPKEGFVGIIVGNEILDALPCARFQRHAGQWWELGVMADAQGLREVRLPPSAALAGPLAELESQLGWQLAEGFTSELLPHLPEWLASVSEGLREGMAVFADYGYPRQEFYLPQRSSGTLIAHYKQRVVSSPYWWPGLCDLSASVDFTAVAQAAHGQGFQVAGFCSQAQFLIGAGLSERLLDPTPRSEREQARRVDEARRLTHASEMGERFKVISLSRGLELDRLPDALKLPFELHRL